MGMILNAEALRKLLDGDLEWLLKQPRTLERDHIEIIVREYHERAEEIVGQARYRRRKLQIITVDRKSGKVTYGSFFPDFPDACQFCGKGCPDGSQVGCENCNPMHPLREFV